MERQSPPWEDSDPALEMHPEGWLQAPVVGNAIAWSTLSPETEAYRISGEFMLYRDLRKGRGQANILLGLTGGDFLQISANSQTGLWVWDYREGKDEFEMIKSDAWNTPFPIRSWVPFEITVTPEEMFVKVHSEEPSPVSVLGRDMSGPWGLGTFKGSATLWRNLLIQEVELGDD